MSKPTKVAVCRLSQGRTVWHRLDSDGTTACRQPANKLERIREFDSRKAANAEVNATPTAAWCRRCAATTEVTWKTT